MARKALDNTLVFFHKVFSGKAVSSQACKEFRTSASGSNRLLAEGKPEEDPNAL
jgi:hypothetical protein